jgi:hypothetical protein
MIARAQSELNMRLMGLFRAINRVKSDHNDSVNGPPPAGV